MLLLSVVKLISNWASENTVGEFFADVGRL